MYIIIIKSSSQINQKPKGKIALQFWPPHHKFIINAFIDQYFIWPYILEIKEGLDKIFQAAFNLIDL